ncbi:MAG: caspase family protein [Candidatus Riflebacteria bacterium]|nr:caspase family protein [Candidatus Riflebacteria bacterium]
MTTRDGLVSIRSTPLGLVVGLMVLSALAAPCRAVSAWEPRNTRAFIVSLTIFQGQSQPSFSTHDRLDGELVSLLRRAGVPADQVVFIKDERATTAAVRGSFQQFLKKSRPGELLLFYFSSHGRYTASTGSFRYVTYDSELPFDWAFDAIDQGFRGSRVLMLADSCYSGGIVELATSRRSRVAYACLSSAYSHNIAFSGWRFVGCLLRGFGGDPVVDSNGDGIVDLKELADFTERHMAFVAEGRPMFVATGGFEPRLKLSTATGRRRPPPIGQYVEHSHQGRWKKAEIVDARPGQVRVRHTDKGATYQAWVAAGQVRPFRFARYPRGTRVTVRGSSDSKLYAATVLYSWESLHYCRYDGYSGAYDQWVGPSRIVAGPAGPTVRAAATGLTGQWAGTYTNTVGEKAADTLTLTEDSGGRLTGTWSGNVAVAGGRTGSNTFQLQGRTAHRSYRIDGRVDGNSLTLTSRATRLDSPGGYDGKVLLKRVAPGR